MGFYGSVYYQIANAFAKILINNAGKENKSFPVADDVISNDVYLEADGRNGTAQFSSGNKWIQLVADAKNNACTIYHAPADTNPTSFVIPLQKINNPTITQLDSAVSLEGGSCFETPVIYYDNAGHLVSSGYTQYFKIPKSDYEQSLDTMQEDIKNLQMSQSKQDEKIQTNTNNISTHNNQISTLNTTTRNIQSFVGDSQEEYYKKTGYNTLTEGILNIQQKTGENTISFQNLYNDFAELKERVRILETNG